MSNFNLYAKYYDLLYKDKDYKKEVDYIHKLIQKYSDKLNTRILDLGCGTGVHANYFFDKGYCVDGVDLSSKMIERASSNYVKNSKINFYKGDITKFRTKKKYNVVTSLFHVMSYQTTNNSVLDTLSTARHHLDKNGLFIFDFWYGPGVLVDPPVIREKILEDSEIRVRRIATPKLSSGCNIVEVNFNINVFHKNLNEKDVISEKHPMRYFFKPEMELFLEISGFKLEGFFNWLTFDSPNSNSWNAIVIAKKI